MTTSADVEVIIIVSAQSEQNEQLSHKHTATVKKPITSFEANQIPTVFNQPQAFQILANRTYWYPYEKTDAGDQFHIYNSG